MDFVASLKEKLDKKNLKILLQSVRSYRDDADSTLFFNVLNSYIKNDLLTKAEVESFRAFVRPADETEFNKILA